METQELESLFKVTEVELIYRNGCLKKDRPKVHSSRDSYKILRSSWDENKIELVEQFKILLLDRANACLGVSDVSTGGMTGCVVDPRIIFATALKSRSAGVIMAHNHPSGNLTPSHADRMVTQRMVEAGRILDIPVLDHLIVSSEGYYSFSDEGLIFS